MPKNDTVEALCSLLGAHNIDMDTPEGRAEFERLCGQDKDGVLRLLEDMEVDDE